MYRNVMTEISHDWNSPGLNG